MGVTEGLVTRKEGEKNNPVTLLLYSTEETTVRQEHRRRGCEAARLQVASKRWRGAGRQAEERRGGQRATGEWRGRGERK